jgi:hypothetical protein
MSQLIERVPIEVYLIFATLHCFSYDMAVNSQELEDGGDR